MSSETPCPHSQGRLSFLLTPQHSAYTVVVPCIRGVPPTLTVPIFSRFEPRSPEPNRKDREGGQTRFQSNERPGHSPSGLQALSFFISPEAPLLPFCGLAWPNCSPLGRASSCSLTGFVPTLSFLMCLLPNPSSTCCPKPALPPPPSPPPQE